MSGDWQSGLAGGISGEIGSKGPAIVTFVVHSNKTIQSKRSDEGCRGKSRPPFGSRGGVEREQCLTGSLLVCRGRDESDSGPSRCRQDQATVAGLPYLLSLTCTPLHHSHHSALSFNFLQAQEHNTNSCVCLASRLACAKG